MCDSDCVYVIGQGVCDVGQCVLHRLVCVLHSLLNRCVSNTGWWDLLVMDYYVPEYVIDSNNHYRVVTLLCL